jgi:hypothetical protein
MECIPHGDEQSAPTGNFNFESIVRLTLASNGVTQTPHVDVYRASFHDG